MSTDPRERPILMSGPLVREILAGRKTQTRRPVKSLRVRLRHEVSSDLPEIIRPAVHYGPGVYAAGMNQHGAVHVMGPEGDLGVKPGEFDFQCPYAEGHTYLRKYPDGRQVWHLQVLEEQRLWVRETWGIFTVDTGSVSVGYRSRLPEGKTLDDTDGGLDVIRVPSEVVDWAAERVDPYHWRPSIFMPRWACRLVLEVREVRVERLQAITEEDARAEGVADRAAFEAKWDEICGRESWDANPWVWAISFRRIDP